MEKNAWLLDFLSIEIVHVLVVAALAHTTGPSSLVLLLEIVEIVRFSAFGGR